MADSAHPGLLVIGIDEATASEVHAAAVMLLAQADVLPTSDRVTRWVPEASPAWGSVTIHELLTHTAGVPNLDTDDEFWPASAGRSAGRQAVLRFRRQPLDLEPGTAFAYSNTAYLVLAGVVEAASGLPFERFVTVNLLEPLGLADTGFDAAAPVPPRWAAGAPRRRSRPRRTGGRLVGRP